MRRMFPSWDKVLANAKLMPLKCPINQCGCKYNAQDVPELGEGYADGAPLLSLVAIPSPPAAEEAAHLPEISSAVFPLEVSIFSFAHDSLDYSSEVFSSVFVLEV